MNEDVFYCKQHEQNLNKVDRQPISKKSRDQKSKPVDVETLNEDK